MKKGFTLIELLAVIAILALLVVIAVPKILQLFNEAKTNAFEVEAKNIVNAAKQGYAKSLFNGDSDETTISYKNGVESKTGPVELNFSGRIIQDGEINITSDGLIKIAIYRDGYCATKGTSSSEITIEKIPIGECLVYPTAESCFTFNSGTITDYDYTNENCPSSVVIPETIGEVEVTVIGANAFQSSQLTGVVIPDNVETIETFAFQSNQISNLTLGEGLISIGTFAFSNNQLTSLTIPGNVENIQYFAFQSNQLTSLTLENGIITIGNSAFYVNQLTNVVIPNSVTTLGDEVFDNNQLTNITIPNSVTSIGAGICNDNLLPDDKAFIYARNPDGSENTSYLISYGGWKKSGVVIPNNVIIIGRSAFSGTNISSITIPNTVTTIKTYAFNSNQLSSIAIPNSVTSIESSAFKHNYILQGNATIDNTSGAVTIGSEAFAYNGSNKNTTITPVYLR